MTDSDELDKKLETQNERITEIETTFKIVKIVAGFFGVGGAAGLAILVFLLTKIDTVSEEVDNLDRRAQNIIDEAKKPALDELRKSKNDHVSEIDRHVSNLMQNYAQPRVAEISVNSPFSRYETTRIPFSWPLRDGEQRLTPTAAYVADITGVGFAELILSVQDVSADGGALYVHNSISGPWEEANFSVKVVAIYY
ncbi:MAG: hypothetical protein H7A04_04540 [Pseudomonadales bacterium]|nr:hypothetical protein [Pseudomonadales bacterium]